MVETRSGSTDVPAASSRIAADPGSPVMLRLTGDDTAYRFAFSTDDGFTWSQVGGTFDARLLSVETSYDFVGVLLGLFAQTRPSPAVP